MQQTIHKAEHSSPRKAIIPCAKLGPCRHIFVKDNKGIVSLRIVVNENDL